MSIALQLIAVAVLCALIVAPALTLLHELGHAVVPLVAGKEPVHIRLGTSRLVHSIRIGRLQLNVARFYWGYGWCSWQTELQRPALALAYGMGPLFSLLALMVLSLATAHTDGFAHHLLVGSCCLAALQLAVTACPMRYPAWFGPYAGHKSDGLHVMEVLRREPEKVL